MSMQISSFNTNLQNTAMRLSTGLRINRAADDAAGMAIANVLERQVRGLNQGLDNTANMQNLVRTAEGGLNTISDSLHRIRELSVQAANTGIHGAHERQIIQFEIDQLMDHINMTSRNVEFNRMPLLDGSFQDRHTASWADGSGASISIRDASAISMGLVGYNVTGNFDLSVIDAALDRVNAQRSELGAMYNRFDHTMEAVSVASLNLAAARSRIVDADMARTLIEHNQQRILEQYQLMAQRRRQENEVERTLSVLR